MAVPNFTTEELQSEEWRPLIGYEAIYNVSNLGRVKRIRPSNASRAGRVLAHSLNQKGYVITHLAIDGVTVKRSLHSLVAAVFIGPRPKGFQINHKDFDKRNNRSTNLEYVTCGENIAHAARAGKMTRVNSHLHLPHPTGDEHWTRRMPERVVRGNTHHNAKLTKAMADAIRAEYTPFRVSRNRLAQKYGVSRATINNVLANKIWR